MSTFEFKSEDEILAVCATLTAMLHILPDTDIPDFPPNNKADAIRYGESALKRLENMETRVLQNEHTAIGISIGIAAMVNDGIISVDEVSTELCSRFAPVIDDLLERF